MALGRLFSALPVRQGDPVDQIEVYIFALEDVSHYAMDQVVAQAIRGQHPKFSRKFAPSTAELGEAIAELTAHIQRQNELEQERLQIADNRPVARKPLLIEERMEAARQKMADEGRRLLLEVDSHAASISPGRKMPPGSVYSGILCAWFGPVGSLRQEVTQEMLRADMFEPETAVDPASDMPPAPPVEAYADVEF